jgi:hypothetical protein
MAEQQTPRLIALAQLAREYVIDQYGRLQMPVAVVIRLDHRLELRDAHVHLEGGPNNAALDVNACFRDIVALLGRTGHRLTTNKILEAFEVEDVTHGESTVRTTLARAVRDGLLTSNDRAKPHAGYGLPGWQ